MTFFETMFDLLGAKLGWYHTILTVAGAICWVVILGIILVAVVKALQKG